MCQENLSFLGIALLSSVSALHFNIGIKQQIVGQVIHACHHLVQLAFYRLIAAHGALESESEFN